MKLIIIGVAIFAVIFSAPFNSITFAEALDGGTILSKMKEAFEPGTATTRTVKFTIRDNRGNVTNTWIAREGRGKLPDGKRTLLVMLEPQEVRGVARLVSEREGGDSFQWMYLPALKRTRTMGPLNSYDSFQGTDFTYSDIGFLNVEGSHHFLGEENYNGTEAYKVETVPARKGYYYKIITFVAKDTFLPLQRNMYDVNGILWKTQLFEEHTVINNIPTPLLVRMLDVQTKTSTEYRVSEVCYGADIPSEIFEPKGLVNALEYDFCPLPSPLRK